jgi:hypothetical protein
MYKSAAVTCVGSERLKAFETYPGIGSIIQEIAAYKKPFLLNALYAKEEDITIFN